MSYIYSSKVFGWSLWWEISRLIRAEKNKEVIIRRRIVGTSNIMERLMDENKEQKQLGKIQFDKTISDQQDALREIALIEDAPEKKERICDVEKTGGEQFYHRTFGVKSDFTEVKIPPKPQMGRNIIPLFVEKRITLDKIISRNVTECIIRINPFLNMELITSPYSSNRAYMVWAANDLRPDLRIMNQRNTGGKRIMTIEERVLLGLMRFQSTSEGDAKYLDLEMPTLTSSYTEIRKEAMAIVVRYQNGGMYIDIQNRNTPGGAREVFGFEDK
jgi:hypothetical protein